jgi:hypothetical protein
MAFNKEQKAAWRKRNRAKHAAQLEAWKRANPDRVKGYQKRSADRAKVRNLARRVGRLFRTVGGPVFYSRYAAKRTYLPRCRKGLFALDLIGGRWGDKWWKIAARINEAAKPIPPQARMFANVARSLRIMANLAPALNKPQPRSACHSWDDAFTLCVRRLRGEVSRSKLTDWQKKFARLAHNINLRRRQKCK